MTGARKHVQAKPWRRSGLAVGICAALGIVSPSVAVARAEFTLDVTQVGYDGASEGPTCAGTCAATACRATLPVKIGVDLCILNVWLGVPRILWAGGPAGGPIGRIRFAAGSCRSGAKAAIAGYPASAWYYPDRFGAVSKTFYVQFEPAGEDFYQAAKCLTPDQPPHVIATSEATKQPRA